MHTVKILETNPIMGNTRQFKVEKPAGYTFKPGQAVWATANIEGWKDKKVPLYFTGLNDWQDLEFTEKEGNNKYMDALAPGDELIIGDPWGTIAYEAPGYFIAGGAGITAFLSIFRQLHDEGKAEGNVLFYSNEKSSDILLKQELTEISGIEAHFIVTDEADSPYHNGKIDEAFLQKHITDTNKPVYVSGPDDMVDEMITILEDMGVAPGNIVFER